MFHFCGLSWRARIITSHSLIMLLIQSDMAKSLWLVVSPLFYFFTKQPVGSSRIFCQVSGFFLTTTIASADIAVLLIAIHTPLFILGRQHPSIARGLEPYRRIAYALWAIVPIILAAIVPITGASFIDNGPHCYLPIQPRWYHNALAWIPRYIIIAFIIVTYSCLYLYVYLRYRRFGKDQRRPSNLSSRSTYSPTHRWSSERGKTRGMPPALFLETHNLLDSPQTIPKKSSTFHQYSATSTASTLQIGESVCTPATPERAARKSSVSWRMVDVDGIERLAGGTSRPHTVPASPTIEPRKRASNENVTVGQNILSKSLQPIQGSTHPTDDGDRSLQKPHDMQNMWKQKLRTAHLGRLDTGPRYSLPNLTSMLRQGRPPAEHTDEDGPRIGFRNLSISKRMSSDFSEHSSRHTRDKMLRHMRLLFVYPAIYILTWIAPFVADLYADHDAYISSPRGLVNNTTVAVFNSVFNHTNIQNYDPVGSVLTPKILQAHTFPVLVDNAPLSLRIISMASLCIGAAVDCAFFSAWERPWRHLRGEFWECLARRLKIHRLCGDGTDEGRMKGPGRNRDERATDERVARIRRDIEREEMVNIKRSSSTPGRFLSPGERTSPMQRGREREWWDTFEDELRPS